MTSDLRLLPAAASAWAACAAVLLIGPWAGWLVAALAALAGIGAWVRLRRERPGRHRDHRYGRAAATVLLAAVVTLAVTAPTVIRTEQRQAAVRPHAGGSADVMLTITSDPRQGSTAMVVWAQWHTPQGASVRVRVLGHGWDAVVPGERVAATARVSPTSGADTAAALLVVREAPTRVASPTAGAARVAHLRSGLVAAAAGLAPQAQGLVPGIAIGDDRALPTALADDLRAVSLTHITAVSGAHVAMVLALVLGAVCWLPRGLRALVGGLALVGLVLLVHPAPSVLRAAVMGAVLLVALVARRPRAALPAMWVGMVVLLVIDPWLATSYGFVLSVLATGGLLVISPPLTDRLAGVLPRPVAMALAIPVAAQLACIPALMLLQPQMPVHGVLANVLAAPAVPPATVLGLAAALVSPISPAVAAVLASWAGVATAWIAVVATWTAGLPGAAAPWWVLAPVLLAAIVWWYRRVHSDHRCTQVTGVGA